MKRVETETKEGPWRTKRFFFHGADEVLFQSSPKGVNAETGAAREEWWPQPSKRDLLFPSFRSLFLISRQQETIRGRSFDLIWFLHFF